MIKNLKRLSLIVPSLLFVKNRLDRGKPAALLPADKKHIVVIGGGIVGLTTSWYLTRDPNCQVTLLEKNKSCMMEASGQDSALFMVN